MHENCINAVTILRDETAAGTVLTLHCLYVKIQVVIFQVGLRCPSTRWWHAPRDIWDRAILSGKFWSVLWWGPKGMPGKRVKKGLIDAHVFHILVLCVLHKSSAAAGAFLGGPKGNKASRSSGRWKCSHSSFSLRDSLCQYSETYTEFAIFASHPLEEHPSRVILLSCGYRYQAQ